MKKTRGKAYFYGGCIGLMVLFCGILFAMPVEATLTAQAINGTVEVLVPGEQTWKPLTATMKVNAGDQVRTGQGGSVELWFEDGSTVSLLQETQLAIKNLDISAAQKTRVVQFKLLNGQLTVKITKLAYTQSTCEIETNIAIAGVKFAEMTIAVPKDSTQTNIIARQGMVDIQQVNDGTVNVSGLVDDEEGVMFSTNSIGAKVLLGIQKIVRKITLENNVPLQGLRAVMGKTDNALEVENSDQGAPMKVEYKQYAATLDTQDAAVFGVPNEQELTITLPQKANVAFRFQKRAVTSDQEFYVFAKKGDIDVNGQIVGEGAFNIFNMSAQKSQNPGKSRAVILKEEPQPSEQEQPVAPPGAEPLSSHGGGEAVETATPTPTATATVIEVPAEESPVSPILP